MIICNQKSHYTILKFAELSSPIRTSIQLLIIITLLISLSGCSSIGGFTKIAIEKNKKTHRYETWSQVFQKPINIKVTAFITGWVNVPSEILIDVDDKEISAMIDEELWVPVLSYLVEHHKYGNLLLDAGMRSGDCSFGFRPFFWIPCRNKAFSNVVSQLKKHNFNIKDLNYILISHFHGDHISGLDEIMKHSKPVIITTQSEIEAVQSSFRLLNGYLNDLLRSELTVATIDSGLQDMPIVEQANDFFGDGSVWLIPTSGHSKGQISVILNTISAPILFTFDASHLKKGFELGIPPGFTFDREYAEISLNRLRKFKAAYPILKVIYGHEPSQWDKEINSINLE